MTRYFVLPTLLVFALGLAVGWSLRAGRSTRRYRVSGIVTRANGAFFVDVDDYGGPELNFSLGPVGIVQHMKLEVRQ